jgi:hypothetical protein
LDLDVQFVSKEWLGPIDLSHPPGNVTSVLLLLCQYVVLGHQDEELSQCTWAAPGILQVLAQLEFAYLEKKLTPRTVWSFIQFVASSRPDVNSRRRSSIDFSIVGFCSSSILNHALR